MFDIFSMMNRLPICEKINGRYVPAYPVVLFYIIVYIAEAVKGIVNIAIRYESKPAEDVSAVYNCAFTCFNLTPLSKS